LAAEGKTGEEIASELGVSPATLYKWRRASRLHPRQHRLANGATDISMGDYTDGAVD
jgi:transposase-like protein